MKTIVDGPRGARGIKAAALMTLGLSLSLADSARADIFNVSSHPLAGQYTIFALGSNIPLATHNSLFGNSFSVSGNVAVGAGTGSTEGQYGRAFLQKGLIGGNLYIDGAPGEATAFFKKDAAMVGDGSTSGLIDGTFQLCATLPLPAGKRPAGCLDDQTFTGTSNLTSAVQQAVAASSYWTGVAATNIDPISLNGAAANLPLTAGVYNAASLFMNSGATLTIDGGVDDYFVLNVTGNFSIKKSFVLLTGGITWDRVLFNVLGTGNTASISGDNTLFFGSLLAVSRNIDIQGVGSKSAFGIQGRIIGALTESEDRLLQIHMYSGARITATPNDPPEEIIPEPATVVLLGTGLAGMALLNARRRRR